jgi:hypothetical protein
LHVDRLGPAPSAGDRPYKPARDHTVWSIDVPFWNTDQTVLEPFTVRKLLV